MQKAPMKALQSALGDNVDSPTATTDIDVERRVPLPEKQNTNKIAVRFVSRGTKNDFQRKASLRSVALPLFLNHHLSQTNQILLAKALQLKRRRQLRPSSEPGYFKI